VRLIWRRLCDFAELNSSCWWKEKQGYEKKILEKLNFFYFLFSVSFSLWSIFNGHRYLLSVFEKFFVIFFCLKFLSKTTCIVQPVRPTRHWRHVSDALRLPADVYRPCFGISPVFLVRTWLFIISSSHVWTTVCLVSILCLYHERYTIKWSTQDNPLTSFCIWFKSIQRKIYLVAKIISIERK